MRYRDRSLLVALYKNRKARLAIEAAEKEPEPESLIMLPPDTVAVVKTIRGYWRGCHPEHGHRWTRDITKAARYKNAAVAERDATNTFLTRETFYRVEIIPFD